MRHCGVQRLQVTPGSPFWTPSSLVFQADLMQSCPASSPLRMSASLGYTLKWFQETTHVKHTLAATIHTATSVNHWSQVNLTNQRTLCTSWQPADQQQILGVALFNSAAEHFPLNKNLKNPIQTHLSQFILDQSSINLPAKIHISPDHPGFAPVLATGRNYCFTRHKERTRQLKQLKVWQK